MLKISKWRAAKQKATLIEHKNAQTLIKAIKTVSKKLDLQGRIHPEFNQFTCPTGIHACNKSPYKDTGFTKAEIKRGFEKLLPCTKPA